MQPADTAIAERRGRMSCAVRAAFLFGCAFVVCGCKTDQQVAGVPDVPADYRMRHPITLTEGDRTLQIFIGSNRGALTPMQRAEVLAFAQSWRHDATGGVIIDLPTGTSNEHASADTLHEIQSILAASGVPPQGMVVRSYAAPEGSLATIRITYPKIVAQAGPCGVWPEDIGPSMNRDYFENQQYWNFGCANQRNLAAMVDNPADLVQPRSETPTYTMRRTTVVEKYRQGQPSATTSPSDGSGKISDLGK
jgi:pilus assembly protein CpaD